MTDPVGVLSVLLAVLAVIFRLAEHRWTARLFKVVPPLILCYFVPALLSAFHIIPRSSPLYDWVKTYLLPAALLMLVLSVDVPGLVRLGPKAVAMLLAGTAGVVLGGPVSLLVVGHWLPDDAWRGMSALAGSWIGGTANFVAVGETAGVTQAALGPIIVVDALWAYLWMGCLLYAASRQRAIDRWLKADTTSISELEHRMTDFHRQTARVPSMLDLVAILAISLGGCWVSQQAGSGAVNLISRHAAIAGLNNFVSAVAWTFILVTAIGVVLSFTPVRRLEGAGASRLGTMIIYLMVVCIGAGADFAGVVEYPALVLMGLVWLLVHVGVLIVVARLIRAPAFLAATGSMANIGGTASAPVVASTFHPSLAPVGALLAVAGYVLGTYCGLLCMTLLRMIAE